MQLSGYHPSLYAHCTYIGGWEAAASHLGYYLALVLCQSDSQTYFITQDMCVLSEAVSQLIGLGFDVIKAARVGYKQLR